jgi:hypothetical protein
MLDFFFMSFVHQYKMTQDKSVAASEDVIPPSVPMYDWTHLNPPNREETLPLSEDVIPPPEPTDRPASTVSKVMNGSTCSDMRQQCYPFLPLVTLSFITGN